MPVYRFTYFFEQFQAPLNRSQGAGYGWTESWEADLPMTLEEALAFATKTSWIQYRVAFLSNISLISWVRVSEVGKRAVKVGGVYVNGTSAGPIAQVQCAVLVTFTAPPPAGSTGPAHVSRRRNALLRGLPSLLIGGNVINYGVAAYAALVNFCRYMTGDLVDRGLSPAAASPFGLAYDDPLQLWSGIQSAAPIGDRTRFTMDATLTTVPGDRVRIRRVIFPRQLNQSWSSLTTGVGLQTLGTARRALPPAPWEAIDGGQARVIRTLVARPQNYLIVGMRNKKTGRPFRQPVGRRRAR